MVRNHDPRVDCYADRLTAQIDIDHPDVLLESVSNRTQSPRVQEDCHDAMHIVAERLVRRGADPIRLYRTASFKKNCAQGFTHGLVAAAMVGSPDSFGEILAQYCSKGQNIAERQVCFHGVGHGLVNAGDDDRFHIQEKCERVDDWVLEGSCLSGAYMELAQNLDNDRPAVQLCDDIPDRSVFKCSEYVPYLLLVRAPGLSTDQLVASCAEQFPSGPGSWGCAQGVGAAISGGKLDQCLAYEGAEAATFCVFAATTYRLAEEHKLSASELCDVAARLRFGCGAGFGFAALRAGGSTGAHACRVGRAELELGCEAGLSQCFPRVPWTGRPDARCRAMLTDHDLTQVIGAQAGDS